MEPTACTINLKLHLSVIAGHLFKQTIFKIQGNENSIFLKEIAFSERKRINTWFPMNCCYGKESKARVEKKYYFQIYRFFF